ncbi:MAG: hypothetical protein H0X69_16920 [Gemmatimonadales bacterium]|nr:hypothetical protein [Gemmatimonadales bacterium]
MPAPEVHTRLLQPLNTTRVPYMVTGGLAAIIYGEPRLTNDVDIVLQLEPEAAERLIAAFPAPAYYAPPIEVVRAEAARAAHGHFNILDVDTALRADVYCLGGDPLGAWAMRRRRDIQVAGANIWVAPIEYVILRKLEYYRMASSDRHLRDVAAMRRISGALIDRAALVEWMERLGLEPEWRMTGRDRDDRE